MALDETLIASIFATVESHAAASGYFETVNGHEPKSAPARGGLTAALWVDTIEPVPSGSGLAATTGRLALNLRVYTSMLAEPQDAIDPAVLAAVTHLMGVFSGDFDLGAQVRNVDLLGQTGPGLSAKAGYLQQDNKIYRVMTILLPIIVNDIWSQSA